jgi:hypothetical protein
MRLVDASSSLQSQVARRAPHVRSVLARDGNALHACAHVLFLGRVGVPATGHIRLFGRGGCTRGRAGRRVRAVRTGPSSCVCECKYDRSPDWAYLACPPVQRFARASPSRLIGSGRLAPGVVASSSSSSSSSRLLARAPAPPLSHMRTPRTSRERARPAHPRTFSPSSHCP